MRSSPIAVASLGFGSKRVMGLGLPLLSILTVSQFRAVLAHEFAHYYGGDTSLGPWVYKTKMAIVRVFENIGSVGQLARIAILGVMYLVVATLLKWYFMGFLRVINMVSRKQEYRADELACIVAGPQSLIGGLRAIQRASVAWPAYWNTEISPILNMGSLPAISDGFARFMAAPMVSEQIEKRLTADLAKAEKDPYDTHPPMPDRIAAAMKLPDASDASDSQCATTLLQKISIAELRFVENQFPYLAPGILKYVQWDEVALRVTIPGWHKFVEAHASALQGVTADSLADQIPKLQEIGSSIPDPKGMLLAPNQRAMRAGHLFASALALALIRSGWALDAKPGIFRIHREEQVLDPFQIMNDLMTNKLSRQDWISKCRELGIAELPLSTVAGQTSYEPVTITQR